jgi:hypothetical protein
MGRDCPTSFLIAKRQIIGEYNANDRKPELVS